MGRVEKSVKNVSFGLVSTLVNAIISFIVRSVLVRTLGIDVLGLNGLFSDIISVISLAELGFGTAIIYHLYEPVKSNNIQKINQLVSLYKTAYRYIAIATIIIGLLVLPFVDKLVTEVEFPLSYIRLVFFLFVIKTASSYLFSYKISLLFVDQRQYIVSTITAVFKLLFMGVSIGALLLTKNYIWYLSIQIVQIIITDIYLSHYAGKTYPYLLTNEKMNAAEKRTIFKNVKDLFFKRIAGVITGSTDSILISTLVSTRIVGLYNNYITVVAMIKLVKSQFISGIAASIGNMMVSESNEKCELMLQRLTFIFFAFSVVICSGFLSIINPFITIWVGKEYLMDEGITLIIACILYIDTCSEPLWQFLEVSGLFVQDKYIGISGSIINLIISVILGKAIGIKGILLGTVISTLYLIVSKIVLIYRKRFNKSVIKYFGIWIKIAIGFFLVFTLNAISRAFITIDNPYFEIVVKGSISIIASFAVILVLFFKTNEMEYSIGLLRSALGKIHQKNSATQNK